MKRNLLSLFLLCIGLCLATIIQAQENFASPINIGLLNGTYDCGAVYTDNNNTCSFINDVPGTNGAPDVVYIFTLDDASVVNMNLCSGGTTYDSYLYLFDAGQVLIVSNDDECGLQSSIVRNLAAGTYYCVVDGYSTACGEYSLEVSIIDSDPPVPVIPFLPNLTGACSVSPIIPTAIDACDGSIISGVTSEPMPFIMTTTVTWLYEDLSGNISSQTQNVIMNDVIAPIITSCPPDITLDAAPDDCELHLIEYLVYDIPISQITGMFDGWWCFGLEAYNSNGAPSFTWNSLATTTPISINVEFFQSHNEHVATFGMTLNGMPDADYPGATEFCIQNLYNTNLNPDSHILGSNTIQLSSLSTWLAWMENPAWSPGSFIRVTEVVSTEVLGTPIATDNCNIASMTNDALDSYPLGVYAINWTVADGAGNTDNCTQTLTVVDVTPPVADIPVLADVSADCEVLSLIDPTATDACGGLVTVTNDAVLPITGEGSTTVVIWTYDDGNGNISTQTQNVIIDDITAPVPDFAVLPDVIADCELAALIDPDVTDNCGGLVTITHDAVLPIIYEGTTVVTWTYDDGNGNTSTQTQNIIVENITPPVPDLAVLPDLTDACLISNLITPTATDACGGSVSITHDAVLPIYGSIVITWFYEDLEGNVSTQTQNVIIDDIIAPLADLPALADVNADCELVSLTEPSATDNCGGTVTVTNDAILPITTQGTTLVTWTYMDDNGNTSTQPQNVILTDVIAPVPDLADLPDVIAECEVTSLVNPSATDNCGGPVIVTNDAVFPINGEGTVTTVTWTYEDVNANTTTQTQNVVINDISGPTPDVATLLDIMAECEITTLTDPSATDNCGGLVTVTNNAVLPIITQGITLITWTYEDELGNITTQEQNVVIDDITPPVPDLAMLPDLTDACEIATLTDPIVTDNCGGLVTVTHDAVLPINASTIVTWSYEDLNGNWLSQTQNVIIDDIIAPVADLPDLADVTAECEVSSLEEPTATDACGGNVSVTNDAVLPITTQGTTLVTWTYMDDNGNTSIQTQNIIITDVTPPTIACPTDLTIDAADASCEFSTNSTIVYDIPVAQLVNMNPGGPMCSASPEYYICSSIGGITWVSTESSAPISVDIQFYQVDNLSGPGLQTEFNGVPDNTYDGLNTICANNLVDLSLSTSNYNVGGVNTVLITNPDCMAFSENPDPTWAAQSYARVTVVAEPVNIGTPIVDDNCAVASVTNDFAGSYPLGTHNVEWTVTDIGGNTAVCNQQITVIDASPPVPDIPVLADVTAVCEIISLVEPTATDACGGLVTVTNDAILPIIIQGTTVVTWTYEDEVGNISTQEQNLMINDITAPIPDFAMLPDLTGSCEITSLTDPTATDNCGGLVTVTHDAVLPIYGTGVITWSFDDGNGNIATQIQNVIVDDTEAPIPDLVTLDAVLAECELSVLEAPTATDACGGNVTATNNAILPITGEGSTTLVTWTYMDDNGNSATQMQSVIIDDITAPEPTLADLPDMTASCEVTFLQDPPVTDNCGGTVIITNDAIFPITGEGTTTVVTWTYDDGNGNTTTQTQNVIIDDLMPPVPDESLLLAGAIEIVIAPLGMTDEIGWELRDASNLVIISGGPSATGTFYASSGNGPYTFIAETQGFWNDNSFSFNLFCDGTNFLSGSIPAGQYLTFTDLESCGAGDYYQLPEYVMECGETITTIPTATDACTGSITGTTTYPLEYADLGTYIITWTYDDGNGNILTQIQDVVVTDLTLPVPDLAVLDPVTESCEVVALTAPTSTDNCAGEIIGTTEILFPIEATTVVEWTYDDGNGNITSQTQSVVIEDVTAPVPDLAVLVDVISECEVASLEEPTATDDCSTEITITNDAVLPITTLGTYVVTWTYEDVNGNISTQMQNVIIEDNIDPVFATLEDVVVSTNTVSCEMITSEVTEYYIPLAQLVGVGTMGALCNGTVDAYVCMGEFGLFWNSTESTVPSNVTVEFYQSYNQNFVDLPITFNSFADNDYTGPSEICVNNLVSVNLNPSNYIVGGLNTLSINSFAECLILDENPDPTWAAFSYVKVTVEVLGLVEPEVTDNCGLASITNDIVPPLGIGDHVVTWTATDFAGNSVSETQNVTVVDLAGPNPDLVDLPDVNESCEVITLIEPTATDNCGGLVTVTSDAVLPITENTTIIWSYEDEYGNITTQEQIVVIDNELPVADELFLADIIEDCSVEFIEYPTATDNCAGTLIGVPDIPMPFTGTQLVTWSFDDGNGNILTQTQNVVVNDIVPPAPDMPILDELTDECSVDPIAPTATDNCSGEIIGVSNIEFPITNQGTTVIVWSFEDDNGNTSTQGQVVNIEDITNPTIEAPEDLIVNTSENSCEGILIDEMVYYINSDDISGMLQNSGLSCNSTPDLYVCNSTASINWTSTNDNIPLYVNLEIYQTYNESLSSLPVTLNGVTDSDYTGPNALICSTDIVSVDLNPENYNSGELNNVDINSLLDCIVFDQNPDPLWESGSYAKVTVGYSTIDNPIALDNCEIVSLTSDVVESYPVGNHTITWTATDFVGNETIATQNLEVADLIGPQPDVADLPDLTANCKIISWVEPTATDVCSGAVVGVPDVSLPILESTTVTWTYTDDNSNEYLQTQNVVIGHDILPTPDVEELDDVIASCEVISIDAPTATSECAEPIVGITDAVFPITEQGSTIVTWTYTDLFGNITIQDQFVYVMDNTDPVVDVAELDEVVACDEVVDLVVPTATDDCTGVVDGVHNATLPIINSTVITWTYEDESGNTVMQTQSVVINTVDVLVIDESPTLIANAVGATYQWLDCDNSYAPIDGETEQSFTATEDGNYAVEVTQNACTDVSDCISVTNSGVNTSLTSSDISVYPNPTSGLIFIEFLKAEEASWKLISITGQVVLEGQNSDDKFSVNMEDLAPGVYILNIQQNDRILTKRVVRK